MAHPFFAPPGPPVSFMILLPENFRSAWLNYLTALITMTWESI